MARKGIKAIVEVWLERLLLVIGGLLLLILAILLGVHNNGASLAALGFIVPLWFIGLGGYLIVTNKRLKDVSYEWRMITYFGMGAAIFGIMIALSYVFLILYVYPRVGI